MKPIKAVKWIFLGTIWNLSAQNNYSVDFGVNTQPTANIKINEMNFGIDYDKTINSKYKFSNELVFNTKDINYLTTNFSNSFSEYDVLRDRFSFHYLKSEKIQFSIKAEPYIASENNLKMSDIDLLGELNVGFVFSPNKKLTIGVSRNNIFGKTMVLPVFSYYYEYNKELNINIGFPESKINYSNNIRNVFSLKSNFNGSIYNLDNSSKQVSLNSTTASFSQLSTGLEYERNMNTNWFVTIKAGYDFNRKYILQDSNFDSTFDFNIKQGYNLGLTIKYKH